MNPPLFKVAMSCFSLAAALFLVKFGTWIVTMPLSMWHRAFITFMIFGFIGIGLVELLQWIESKQVNIQPISKAPIIEQAPLVVRSTMINAGYPLGTKLGGIIWTPELRDLRVTINNETDYDYQDMDITIRLHLPIRAIGQITNVSGVTFVTPEPQFWQGPNGEPIVKWDSTTGHTLGDQWEVRTQNKHGSIIPIAVYPYQYRVRCDKLPHRTSLEIIIAIDNKDILVKGKINSIRLSGQYLGRLNTRTIDETISVSN